MVPINPFRTGSRSPDLIKLDEALEALNEVDPKKCDLVELKYFAGLTNKEIADVMEIPLYRVERKWALAKAWLHKFLSEEAHERNSSIITGLESNPRPSESKYPNIDKLEVGDETINSAISDLKTMLNAISRSHGKIEESLKRMEAQLEFQ